MQIGPLPPFTSMVTQAIFPQVLGGRAAELQALLRLYDHSQYWPPAQMRAAQFAQLSMLVAHAAESSPFYQLRLSHAGVTVGGLLSEEDWARIPILTRGDIQAAGPALRAHPVPANLSGTYENSSGGSTSEPVRVTKSNLDALFWDATTLRDVEWHNLDVSQNMVRISRTNFLGKDVAENASGPAGALFATWGEPHSLVRQTGQVHFLHAKHSPADQLAFIAKHRPAYLFTFPSVLRLLLAHIREHRLDAPQFRAVMCLSEMVDPTLRALCREILGVSIISAYSAAETGIMALQCPMGDGGLHVMSESHFVEVLDDDGRAVGPGETGRVVVTPMHNFVTPLLRYEIGDRATVGEACPCGRGLPHLTRIDGRVTDYLVCADGSRRFPDTGHHRLASVGAIREYQFIQRTVDLLELRLVVGRDLSAAEEAEVRDIARRGMGEGFRLDIRVVDRIERTAAGKLRAFLSDLPGGAGGWDAANLARR